LVLRASVLQQGAEDDCHSLMTEVGSGAHDEHPVNQLVTVPVVGHPVEALDGERLARLWPGFGDVHSTHAALRASVLSSFLLMPTVG
jgi:hypothetical protein